MRGAEALFYKFCVDVGLFGGTTTLFNGQSQPGLVLLPLQPVSRFPKLPTLLVPGSGGGPECCGGGELVLLAGGRTGDLIGDSIWGLHLDTVPKGTLRRSEAHWIFLLYRNSSEAGK